MSNTRNYTDDALERFAQDLSEGEKYRLVSHASLPQTFRNFEPNLRGEDVDKMMEIIMETPEQ
jgi:hypothetical protein